MKFMVEISRGCPCMCRFCWAGYNYLPVRGFTRARARGARARGAGASRTRSASSRPRCATTRRSTGSSTTSRGWTTRSRSPRCGSTTSPPSFVFKLADTGVQGLTLAPECGSDRMRKILNKQFTNDEILDKATWIFENGIQNLKLYYMVGLPFEKHADVEAIVDPDRPDPRADAGGGAQAGAASAASTPRSTPSCPSPGRPTSGCPWRTRRRPTASSSTCARPSRACPTSTRSARAPAPAPPSRSSPSADRRVADALEIAVAQAGSTSSGRCARPGLDPAFYLFRAPREGRGPALGHRRQRRQQGLLLEGARSDRGSSALAPLPRDPGLHPLRRLPRDPEPLLHAAREVEGPGDAAPLRANLSRPLSLSRERAGSRPARLPSDAAPGNPPVQAATPGRPA